MGMHGLPFPEQVREFVDSAPWRFAKTYAATWPHEYVVRTEQNAALILALARHIFEQGVDGRFYSQVRKYHHEGGKVYWSMAAAPEGATLINRCDEGQTYEARLAADSLPPVRVWCDSPGSRCGRSFASRRTRGCSFTR